METYINWNGALVQPADFHISPENRSFRYGDGFFETMKVTGGQINLEALHMERFFSSLQLLQFEAPSHFTDNHVRVQINLLLERNGHMARARVRLMVYRGNGGVYDPQDHLPYFLIQSWPLSEQPQDAGLHVAIFPDARKACDAFSAVKSNNYLCYLMGALFAKKRGLHDALILNTWGRIADATIANVFVIKNGMIQTPPLTEGCINGVYRRHLLQCFAQDGIPFQEAPITIPELLEAEEVFLTNAITGMRSVSRCGDTVYDNKFTALLKARYGDG